MANLPTGRLDTDRLWGGILRRAQLARHPRGLSYKDRRMQFLVLSAMSADPNDLPVNRERWEAWYLWHEEAKP